MRYLLLVLPAMFVASCAGVPEQYVKADRATFEAIAPKYERYVDADDTLDADQKERRKLVLETWDMRLKEAEAGVK